MNTSKTLLFLGILCTCGLAPLTAQQIIGQVVDRADGSPLIGASILIVGTTTGAVTDIDGNFALRVQAGRKYSLEASYTGYQTERVESIFAGDTVQIVLRVNSQHLEEVVVTRGRRIRRRKRQAALTVTTPTTAVRQGASERRETYRPVLSPDSYDITYERVVEPESAEQYNAIEENPFLSTGKQPTSTLSTDVDRAAYANVRRFLHAGQLPPPDAVRSEEMINYFRYADGAPTAEDGIVMHTELAECPWNAEHQLLRVNLRTTPIATEDVPASNLVFLLDVSGSMSAHNKLPLLKQSLALLVDQLRPEDRVSIVVYAGAAGLVLPATPGNLRDSIVGALDRLKSGGSTAGAAGIQLAYDVARKHFIQGGNNRVILATDGDFNVGTSSQAELVKLIEAERNSGVYLTVLGFGRGNLQDGKMQMLAGKGNGNHAYIDAIGEAKKVLIDEFGATLFTVANDVKLQLEFDPKTVKEYRLIGYENRLLRNEDFANDKIDAAELGAGHTVTVLYELVPAAKQSATGSVGELRMRYKTPGQSVSKLLKQPIAYEPAQFSEASEDLRWSAAVAEFALLLRRSEHAGTAGYDHLTEIAKAAVGYDPDGTRKQMLGMIGMARGL